MKAMQTKAKKAKNPKRGIFLIAKGRFSLYVLGLIFYGANLAAAADGLSRDQKFIDQGGDFISTQEEFVAFLTPHIKKKAVQRGWVTFEDSLIITLDARRNATVLAERRDWELFSINVSRNRFIGQIRSREEVGEFQKITGSFDVWVELPVLKRTVAAQQLIKESDIMLRRMKKRGLPRNFVVSKESIIGLAAQRSLGPDRPLRTQDFRHKEAIKRRSVVLLRYNFGNLRLATQGTALQSGAIGDTIRVRNIQSDREILGFITAQGVVDVVVWDSAAHDF